MFAEINVQLLEPNVLYLDEKPPKVVKHKRDTKKAAPTKKMAKRKEITKKSNVKKSKKSKGDNVAIKKESQIFDGQNKEDSTGNDPLCTSDKDIKMENDSIKYDEDGVEYKVDPYQIPNAEAQYSDVEDCKDVLSALEEDEEYEVKFDQEFEDDNDESDNADSDEYYDEDEPLIMLTRGKGRPRKHLPKEKYKTKIPRMQKCRDICKQHCTQKFTEVQRRKMCDAFWSLSEEDKILFIRRHTLTHRFTRLKRKKPCRSRGNNSCYYLDDDNIESPNLIRVCRRYFETTLCITNYTIKKALEGYEPLPDLKPLMEQQQQVPKPKEKTEEIVQLLDPETGNLITIDPKEAKKHKSSAETSKKKRTRRKPGDPMPERFPKAIKCDIRCIYKCHTKFTEDERKQMCDIFWSMDYQRRKDFILARIQTIDVETQTTPEFRKSNRPPRAYHTRFFLRSGINGENKRVCKHFMMATLSINRNFITNAIEYADKKTGYYTGKDRRGQNSAPNKISADRIKVITDHISSYPTWIPNKKSKSRFLHHKLTIKRMYSEYKDMCMATENKFVSTHIYYKCFHDEFRLSFLSNPEPKKGGGFLNLNPNISHYTGSEPGGIWLDMNGEKLDTNLHNPWENFIQHPPTQSTEAIPLLADPSPNVLAAQQSFPQSSTISFNTPLNYAQLMDPTLNASHLCQPPIVRHEFNTNMYDINLPHAHAASSSSLFRRL